MHEIVGGATRGCGEVTIGLVDDDHVGELHDPALDALELVTAGRRGHQHEQVDQIRHRHLRLADADGLHDHQIEPGGLAQQHRLPRAASDAAQGAR